MDVGDGWLWVVGGEVVCLEKSSRRMKGNRAGAGFLFSLSLSFSHVRKELQAGREEREVAAGHARSHFLIWQSRLGVRRGHRSHRPATTPRACSSDV